MGCTLRYTKMIIQCHYGSQATPAFLGMLPLYLYINKLMESKAEMPAASGVQIRLYSVHPKFVPFIIYKQIDGE